MIKIEFNLEQEHIRWFAEMHQLNSDILRRHILPKIRSGSYSIDIDYCEKTNSGIILSNLGHRVGSLTVFDTQSIK
ncbi:hypothetical protein DI392_03335 [Vibrio albus]|uniref:Uncharacterized protein n=1 Tax=Vibrio albus TaxID=2200953 RepID=A0A2U3BET9_9VIBR|nr:hypothetical protein DI392_03335 [Vibrio albus]